MQKDAIDVLCKGCLALSGSGLCDLGKKFIRNDEIPTESNLPDVFCKISNMEDYLVAHLLNM